MSIDEIIISSGVQYLGGEVTGYADNNPSTPATSILGVMITPIQSKTSYMLRLIPCANLKCAQLVAYTKSVLSLLKSLEVIIVTLLTDNCRLNQSLISNLAGQPYGELCSIYTDSAVADAPIHLMIDPVHLLKSIRNNWMTSKILTFNHPETHVRLTAKFSDLVKVYEYECGSLLRIAYGLTRKSISPNDIEKQQVS